MPEQAPTIVIHGTLNEVGTRYDDQATIVVAVDRGELVTRGRGGRGGDTGPIVVAVDRGELVTLLVTKEQAKLFGPYLYGPVTITVTAQ